MVSTPLRIMMIGSGVLAQQLSGCYQKEGHEVVEIASGVTAQIDLQLNLVVLADNDLAVRHRLHEVTRTDLAASMRRFTYEPFAAAVALRPQLAASKGRIVLLTSAEAQMAHIDTIGAYLERPFRAAAHALWRCLSVEWQAEGITCGLVAVGQDPLVEQLAKTILGNSSHVPLVELKDSTGRPLDW